MTQLAPPGGVDRVVIFPVANMFSSPTDDADVVSQAILGSNVTSVENRGDWVKVRTDDDYAGWMSRDTLRELANLILYGSVPPVIRIEALFANVYREPSVRTHQPVLTAPFDSLLEVSAEGPVHEPGWTRVRLPDRRTGWIRSEDGSSNLAPLSIPESIELAKRFLGVPYLWGGRSSFGFDCSGFTQMLVRRRGITMPRDANLQAAWEGVEEISRRDLRKGDLVFFGSAPEKITHTAHYIGGGEIIHSTAENRPGVQIGRLNARPSVRNLVACRRLR